MQHTRALWSFVAVSAISMSSLTAKAEVKASAADGFSIQHEYETTAPPEAIWDALETPGAWWPDDHSWSGQASNMSLVPAVGGCWCETWENAAAVHGRVIAITPGKMIRYEAPLGPLQGMGVASALTVQVGLADLGGAEVRVDYVVTGASFQSLDKLAPIVDQVMQGQFQNLIDHVADVKLD